MAVFFCHSHGRTANPYPVPMGVSPLPPGLPNILRDRNGGRPKNFKLATRYFPRISSGRLEKGRWRGLILGYLETTLDRLIKNTRTTGNTLIREVSVLRTDQVSQQPTRHRAEQSAQAFRLGVLLRIL